MESSAPGLNNEQRNAVRGCTSRSLHYVWGPPGTGKTATLAETVRALADREERVLVLAHSNIAVDVAMSRASDVMAGSPFVAEGRVLRIGTPQLPDLAKRAEVLPEGVLSRRWPELFADRDRLRRERRLTWKELECTRDAESRKALSQQLEKVRKRLKEIQTRIRELTGELISQAQLVGCTLSRLVIDEDLWKFPADAVIIDEVSMAAFAQVLVAGSRACRRLLLFGDPRQLPPIHLASTPAAETWLGTDAFAFAGVSDPAHDQRVSFLSTQYRMGETIARVVSELAYGGRLVTPEAAAQRARELAALAPTPGRELVVVDTSRFQSASVRETRRGSYSRVNPVHLALATSLISALQREGCVSASVISPYRAQAQLAGRALRELSQTGTIRAATVHRFQGSESDAVVVDLVDAPPQRGASHLTGSNEDTATRLINVALSRARGKLVVLADVPFLLNRHPPGSPARRLLELAGEDAVVSAESVLNGLPGAVRWARNWPAAQDEMAADILAATKAIVGHLPEGFLPGAPVVEAVGAVRSTKKLLFAPVSIATRLEATDADLRLRPRGCGFVLVAAPVAAWVGGTDPGLPVARIKGEELAEALQDSLFADALSLPGPSADAEEHLSRACGRCLKCGKQRAPRFDAGAWVLRCPVPEHPREALDLHALTSLARASGAACADCGGPPLARSGPRGPFLVCESFGAGCEGRTPTLEDLFNAYGSISWPT